MAGRYIALQSISALRYPDVKISEFMNGTALVVEEGELR
jgi:hypothetical protein